MIANKVKLTMGTGSIRIDPVFKTPEYTVVNWEEALAKYRATATWRNLSNAESYGLFSVDPEGRAFFAPSKAGTFDVDCEVLYFNLKSQAFETIDQTLTVTVENASGSDCTCEVKISARAGNILTKEADGLYVPSVDVVVLPAGGAVELHTGVYEKGGQLYHLDYRDEANISKLIGITLKAGYPGDAIPMQKSGIIESPQFNFVEGRVYLGPFGRLTQTPTVDHGFHVYIGAAVSKTRLVLNFQDPIKMG